MNKKAIEAAESKPVFLPFIAENIPPELRALRQWVAWQARRVKGRWTKVPIDPRTGVNAKSTDSETWGTFAQAAGFHAGRADGVGFVVNGNGIVGIDLDDVRNPDTGELTEAATKMIEEFRAYAELSPSGTGLRIFCRGTMPEDGRKVGAIEYFASKKYLTVTGQKIPGCPDSIEERQATRRPLCRGLCSQGAGGPEERPPGRPPKLARCGDCGEGERGGQRPEV